MKIIGPPLIKRAGFWADLINLSTLHLVYRTKKVKS